MQRACRKTGCVRPQKTENDTIRAGRGPFRPVAPNRLRGTDTAYAWCGIGGRRHCLGVADCPARRWVACAFDVHAAGDAAADSITSAAAAEEPDCPGPRLRTGSGSRYAGRGFRRAVRAPGIGRHGFIRRSTPGQNGHAESFHKTPKREYVWPHESADCREAERIIAEAIADYNKGRMHPSIGYMTPAESAELWEMANK